MLFSNGDVIQVPQVADFALRRQQYVSYRADRRQACFDSFKHQFHRLPGFTFECGLQIQQRQSLFFVSRIKLRRLGNRQRLLLFAESLINIDQSILRQVFRHLLAQCRPQAGKGLVEGYVTLGTGLQGLARPAHPAGEQ